MFEKARVTVDTDIATIESYRSGKIVAVNFTLKKAVEAGEEARLLAQLIQTYVTSILKPREELLVISGRGPIWLYALIYHYLHGQVANIGFFDPKLRGAIVIGAHYGFDARPGDLVELPDDVIEKLLGQPPK